MNICKFRVQQTTEKSQNNTNKRKDTYLRATGYSNFI